MRSRSLGRSHHWPNHRSMSHPPRSGTMLRTFGSVPRIFGRNRAVKGRRSHAQHPSVDGLERRELLSTVMVYGTSNIYGAGLASPPAPGNGGGGVLPTPISLSALGSAKVIDFPTVTGTVSGWAAQGHYNGPDGGTAWGGVTNVRAWKGISGIQDNNRTMFLVGVFLGPNGQPATAPPTLNVTNANSIASFSPLMGQQFFIGDGRTSSQALQTFNVPAGATRLFLGFAESYGFGNPNLLPGFYSDNGGALAVDVESITPTSLSWNTAKGGVNFSYSAPDPLPFSVPVDFYWSPTKNFVKSADVLAATSLIEDGQKPSPIHLDPSSLTAPPTGTNYLLVVLSQNPNNTLSLAYDPEITVTGTYNGSTDPGTIGRFLAVPGLVTEQFIDKLSPSLAALRQSVGTFINNGQYLEAEPDSTLLGGWDGVTYITDGFDPGSLSKSAQLTTEVQVDNDKKTPLKEVDTTLDVQPLPDWYKSLQSPTIIFMADSPGKNGIATGSYIIRGAIANLAPPVNATIPSNVAFVGGKSIGATATFGLAVNVPLSITANPVVSGYTEVALTVLNAKVFTKDIDLSTSSGLGDGASLTVTPQVTLDPNTLQPNGAFGVAFEFTDTEALAHTVFYSNTRPITISGVPLELSYSLYDDLKDTLKVDADMVFSANDGFVVNTNPNLTFVSTTLTGTLNGEVDVGYFIPGTTAQAIDNLLHKYLPQYFSANTALPALKLGFVVSGGFTFTSRFNYTGSSSEASPVPVSFGGSLTPQIQSRLTFTIGTKTISSPSIAIFGTIPSLMFNGNGQYTFNKMG